MEGDTDKELFAKYITSTEASMAALDPVHLPDEFVEKLHRLLDSITADEFDGSLDDSDADV